MEQEQVAKVHAELPEAVLRKRDAAAMNGNAYDVVQPASERSRERSDGCWWLVTGTQPQPVCFQSGAGDFDTEATAEHFSGGAEFLLLNLPR